MFYPDQCTGCGRCAGMTVNDTDFICFTDAKEIIGKSISAAVRIVLSFWEN